MRRRLRPLRSQRRVRFRLTWPTIVLPIVAVVLLARGDTLRAPLGEREAAIAIAAQSARGARFEPAAQARPAAAPAAPIAAVSVAQRFLTSGEFHLRIPGVLAGGAALGLAIVLGERLFATRVGLLAAVLLLALPAGRSILGIQLGGEPFYLLAMLVALAAIRDVSESRVSAVVAGIASGAAVAYGGRDGFWLILLGAFWLWWNQGLTWRSFLAVAAPMPISAIAITLIGMLWLGPSAAGGATSITALLQPQLSRMLASRAELAWSLTPLLPLAILGLGSLPPRWWSNPSLQFLLAWLFFALVNLGVRGSLLPAFVATLYLAAMLIVWGIERSRRALSIGAVAVAIAIAIGTAQAPAAARGDRSLDRWAVREAGRFLWRTVPAERPIAAAPGARGRLAYYGRRPVDPLPSDGGFGRADYVVLTRDDFRAALRTARHAAAPDGGRRAPLKMVAEFGPWVIARVEHPGPSPGRSHAPRGPEAGPNSGPPSTP